MGLAQYAIVPVRDEWGVLHDGEINGKYATKEAAFESAVAAVKTGVFGGTKADQPQSALKVDLSRSMGNGICRIFNRGHRHFGMRDHARMIATRNVVDFRLRPRGEFLLNVGWYDFVGVTDDVPRRDRLPTNCS